MQDRTLSANSSRKPSNLSALSHALILPHTEPVSMTMNGSGKAKTYQVPIS